MNVYEKLQTCRIKLQEMNLRKSGKNTFANYDYYELQDFLPPINRLFEEHKLFSQVTFTSDIAMLTIVNTEKPDETILFTSPMAEAKLKGTHPIQNLGAVQSYQRRYLYQTALEIVEHDVLDSTTGKEKAIDQVVDETIQRADSFKGLTDGQKKMIHAKLGTLVKKHNTSKDVLLKKAEITDIDALSSSQASTFIDTLIEWEKA